MPEIKVETNRYKTRGLAGLICLTFGEVSTIARVPKEIKRAVKSMKIVQDLLITILNMMRQSKLRDRDLFDAVSSANTILNQLASTLENILSSGRIDLAIISQLDNEIKQLERIAKGTDLWNRIKRLLEKLCVWIARFENALDAVDEESVQNFNDRFKFSSESNKLSFRVGGEIFSKASEKVSGCKISGGIFGVVLSDQEGRYELMIPKGFRFFICPQCLSDPLFYSGTADNDQTNLNFELLDTK
ncbi:MAG: hypothetical protein N2654_02245 [Deltaproteobacteria bacterium]|nr:hypothetical protein [Deltaproteobacteria bacterium]